MINENVQELEMVYVHKDIPIDMTKYSNTLRWKIGGCSYNFMRLRTCYWIWLLF